MDRTIREGMVWGCSFSTVQTPSDSHEENARLLGAASRLHSHAAVQVSPHRPRARDACARSRSHPSAESLLRPRR
eukprot:6185952-Pleurochrysis_carterae.AAC.1